MYKMRADGVVFYDPSSDDSALHVLNPQGTFEVNKVDNLTFKMLPNNVLYDGLKKMVTKITLEQDGEVIFRGRVLEATTDKYNIKEVYCEGELGYLHDSCIRPYEFDGKAIDLFRKIVAWHNEQVDEYKRFNVGIITAIDEDTEAKTDSQSYADALAELRQMFVSVHKGYLRVRTVNGVRYLDYIKEFTDDCEQPIAFGVNLVDIENKIDAGDVFSVLVPLGGYNTASRNDPVNISSVNDGKDYIEDAGAIAKYGRIVKTYKWEDCKDPEELMARGYEQFAKLKENRTITIKAVDLHIIDTSHEAIRVGMNVMLQSDPHRLNEQDACTRIKLNIEKPEETEYTFGYPPESLTDSNVAKNIRTNHNYNGLHKWVTETNESFEVFVDEVNGKILLKADNVRVEAIETEIKGLLKVESLQAAIADLEDVAVSALSVSGTAHCTNLQVHGAGSVDGDLSVSGDVSASGVDVETLTVGGTIADWKGGTFVTNLTITQNKNNATVQLADGTTKWIQWVEGVTITPTTAYINYMGKA